MNEETERKVSRRGMIKRLGGATLVAWTAPVISTVGVPVSAKQFSHETQICFEGCVPLGQTGEAHCGQQFDCAAEHTGNPCTCLRTRENTCACHSCVFCDHPAVNPCPGGPTDCPPGWICAMSCCSDPASVDDFVCHPSCGGGDNPDPCVGVTGAAAAGRRTSMG
jgi:hypothetical protein